jgi:hypothetical protein
VRRDSHGTYFCCSGGKDEPKEDGSFDQPGLGDYQVVEGVISNNLVEAQFADAERDSLGSHKQPLGVKDSNGTDVFSLMQFCLLLFSSIMAEFQLQPAAVSPELCLQLMTLVLALVILVLLQKLCMLVFVCH